MFPQPTAEPTDEPTDGPTPAPSKSPVVVSRWYPKALVEIGADGCDYGHAYLDVSTLANWVYVSERECCMSGSWCTAQDDNTRNVDPTTTTTTTVSPRWFRQIYAIFIANSFLQIDHNRPPRPSR